MKPNTPCRFPLFLVVVGAILFCGCGDTDSASPSSVVVNSAEDPESPPWGTVTLRTALEAVAPGGTIRFEESLDGATIALSIVGEEHTILKGEVMGMRDEPSGPVSYLVGYFDRDYGPSALYARKSVTIDASDLPSGITVEWTGGAALPARVLAVYGDLTLNNVTITGGDSVAEEIVTYDPDAAPGAVNSQPWTLARGGAVAVWGEARLTGCTLHDNHCSGDFDSSRDRGAFGGGLYANIVRLTDSVVSGNTVLGAGAAGGGVYSLGGAATSRSVSTIERSSITGNRISGLFAYGAGVYSDGGGIGNRKTLILENCTIAQNLAGPAPGLPPFLLAMGYWRGGGAYVSNGYMELKSCTVVGNEVYGLPRTDSLDRPNLAGGIAATIGNAHAVETLTVEHSIVAGNTVHELGPGGDPVNTYGQDIFTGSLLHFLSGGHNRIGTINFSQILVPVGEPDWESLSRKHYPKHGDEEDVDVSEVLDMTGGVTHAADILSAGVDESQPAMLHVQPRGSALDQIPASYPVTSSYAEYEVQNGASDDFLAILLARLEAHYEELTAGFAAGFTAGFEDYLQSVDTDDGTPGIQPHTDPTGTPILTLAETLWFGPAVTWPKEVYNYPYIEFWHRLDAALLDEDIGGMGAEGLGEAAWSELFSSGSLTENTDIGMRFIEKTAMVVRAPVDQLGVTRPAGAPGDIGAIELP